MLQDLTLAIGCQLSHEGEVLPILSHSCRDKGIDTALFGSFLQDRLPDIDYLAVQLNPLSLQRELAAAIDKLWKLQTVDPTSERAQRLREAVHDAGSR